MNKTFIAIASLCLIIAALSPLISYNYFENQFNIRSASDSTRMNEMQQRINDLEAQNNQLRTELNQAPNISKPYLVTKLGWYLHKSNDPITTARNSFTLYGTVANIGLVNCTKAVLTINFYSNSSKLIQKSTLSIAPIYSLSVIDLVNRRIDCGVADTVDKIEIGLDY